MRKGFSTVGLAIAATAALLLATAAPAAAHFQAPTPANASVISGTVTLFNDGGHSRGRNLFFGSCQGSTTITVRAQPSNVVVHSATVSGSGGSGPPIPLTTNWITDNFANGTYTATGTEVSQNTLCLGTSTQTDTRTYTVQNTGNLAYGGDIAKPTGTAATVKATLTDQNNIAPPAGQTVNFALSGQAGSVNATTVAGGVAQTTLNVTGAPRPATLTITYSGPFYTAKTITQAFTVQPVPTTTTVTSSTNPSVFGQPVSFTANVASGVSGSGTPTGSVQFVVDGNNFGGPVAVNGSGQAPSGSIATLAAGPHSVVANYTATGNFASSTGGLTQTVNKASTTTSVTSSVNPSVFGQTINFTATVTAVAPGAGIPTGNVTFQQNGQPIGGPVALNGAGQATSDDISILAASPTHPITATYQGSSNFNGSSITANQAVNKADTSTSVVSSSAPSVFGQAVTFSSTVSAVAPGAGTPTGTVTYTVDGNQLGSPVTLSPSGQATSASTAMLSPGDHTVDVAYSGDSNFNSSTITYTQHVDQAATTTSVSSSVNPSVFGQSVTFSAAVAVVAPGAGTPTGTVIFTVDGNPLGSPAAVDGAGNATSDPIDSLSVGPHTVDATYSGDTNFTGSSDSLTQTVNKAATSTAVTSSVNPSVFGQGVTFDATVTVTAPGAGTPSGTVSFFDGATLLSTQPLVGVPGSGTASFSTGALSVGTHAISAVYSGDGNFLTSTGNVTQTVNKAQSATTVAANGPIVQGQPVTFNASVVAVAPGTGIPSGTVQFKLNGAPQGSPVALDSNGNATSAPIAGLTPGNFRITATYAGDINFLPSEGSVGQVVNPGATTMTLVASPSPSAYGAPVTLTATVAIVPPAIGLPTGTVNFFDGPTLIGTGTLADGVGGNQASTTVSGLAVGVHNFSATYLGDFNFASAGAGPIAHTVQGDPTTTALTSSPNPSTFNAPVTLTANVTPALANANPITGTMSFYDGASLIGTAPVSAGGSASLSVSNLSVGTHSLTAAYSGDATYGASTSPVKSHTVNKAQPSLTTSRSGSLLSAVLTTPQGPLGGQTLVFKTGTTTICTVTTGANGGASCTANLSQQLQISLNGYTVTYNGNANYLPALASGS